MRAHIIDNGVVTNTIEVESLDFMLGLVSAVGSEGIGWTYSGGVFSPPAPVMPTVSDYVTALTNHLDATAQTKSYDNRITCAVRAGYPGPFQAEGIAFATWMDAQNAKGYQILANVRAGTIPQPTIPEFMAMFDPMIWPT